MSAESYKKRILEAIEDEVLEEIRDHCEIAIEAVGDDE